MLVLLSTAVECEQLSGAGVAGREAADDAQRAAGAAAGGATGAARAAGFCPKRNQQRRDQQHVPTDRHTAAAAGQCAHLLNHTAAAAGQCVHLTCLSAASHFDEICFAKSAKSNVSP